MTSQNPKTIWNLKKYHQVRAAKIAQLGGQCVDCGSTEDLQFDHEIAEGKAFTVSTRITNDPSLVNAELDKCVLRCGPCHLAKSRASGDLSNRGGLITCPTCGRTCNKGGMSVHRRAKHH